MEILETIVVGMSQNVKKKTKSQGMELTNQSWRSLVLTVVHMCLKHPLKAQIFVYLMMYGRSYPELIKLRKYDF